MNSAKASPLLSKGTLEKFSSKAFVLRCGERKKGWMTKHCFNICPFSPPIFLFFVQEVGTVLLAVLGTLCSARHRETWCPSLVLLVTENFTIMSSGTVVVAVLERARIFSSKPGFLPMFFAILLDVRAKSEGTGWTSSDFFLKASLCSTAYTK